MTALTYQTLKTKSEIKLHSITHAEFKILKNEHAKLMIKGVAKDDTINGTVLKQALAPVLGTIFTLYRDDGEEESPLFCGIVEKLNLLKENGIDYFELEVASFSILLDRQQKKRSFQNVTMTYADIAKEILSEYTNGSTICTIGEDIPIGTPLVQYEETDWQFLKRIASHFEGIILPEYKHPYPRVWFGFPNTINTVEISQHIHTQGQATDYLMMEAANSKYTRDDFHFVETESYGDFEHGDFTAFKGKGYILYEKHGKIDRGELLFTYRFGSSGLMKAPKFYNDTISGMSLLGEVAKDDKEDVYVKLDIDNGAGGTYPYPFRPETGNMMYCMPQVGTKVSLYFPTFDEHKAMVINCFRTNGDDCEQTADPSKRAFTTEHGKELDLYPSSMGLKSNTTKAEITLDDKTGINIYSHNALTMVAQEINFNAPIINVLASLGEINIIKRDPLFPLVTSSMTLSNQFDFLSKGGNDLIGKDFVNYLAFDDEPNKKSFVGGLFKNVLAGLAVVGAVALTLATFGAAGPVIVGACIGGAMAVGIMAGIDVWNGEVSSTDEYKFAGLSGAITGAISGGLNMLKLGKLAKVGLEVAEGVVTGAGESIASQMILDGKGLGEISWGSVGFNSLINGGIAVAVPGFLELKPVKKYTESLTQSIKSWKDQQKVLGIVANPPIGNNVDDVARKVQKEALDNAPPFNQMDNYQKSNVGEMRTDLVMEDYLGSKRAGNNRVTDISAKQHHGLDGSFVPENPPPPPQFYFVETKHTKRTPNTAKSRKKGGGPRQMSDEWFESKLDKCPDRFAQYANGDDVLAEQMRTAFRKGETIKLLSHVKPNGDVILYKIGENGKRGEIFKIFLKE